MPGLKQLERFRDELSALGKELTIARERGEPVNTVVFPEGISENDDTAGSFVSPAGVPEPSASENDIPDMLDDDILSELTKMTGGDAQDEPEKTEPVSDDDFSDFASELDSLFDGGALDEPADSEFSVPEDLLSDDIPAGSGAVPGPSETDDALLDNLAAFMEPPAGYEGPENTPDPAVSDIADADAPEAEGFSDMPEADFGFDAPETEGLSDMPETDSGFDAPEAEGLSDMPEADSGFDVPEAEELSDMPEAESGFDVFDLPDADMFSVPEEEPPAGSEPEQAGQEEEPPSFDAPPDLSFDDFSFDGGEDELLDLNEDIPQDMKEDADILPGGDFEELPSDEPSDATELEPEEELPPEDDGLEDIADLPDVTDNTGGFDDIELPDDIDSYLPDDGEPPAGPEPFPPADGDEDFSISGFPDIDNLSALPVPGKKELPREFTEDEYRTFLKNLESYPLNLRIAVEQMVSGNEFNDDAVIAVIRKVIERPSAKELAGTMGKILDKLIDIPRDFEKRTAAEYETYKASFRYKLFNRIIPAVLIAVAACAVSFLLFIFGNRFVYRPMRAESLYKEGYTLLQDDYFTQSQLKFDEATSYYPKKRWFFRYAQGYRDKHMFGMAEQMYERILARYDNDKEAGLEYASMEQKDLRNYEKAETILRRNVLDNHINDPDGMLLLGDVYLDWAQDKDPSKYENARSMYASLIQLYGRQDVYLSRMMRYFIRTDNLAEVLPLKEYFYPKKKKGLEADDLTELSGYLLDKLYGPVSPKDEYLIPYIQDVRELLERAAESDPSIPETHYNLGRYFVYTGNPVMAESALNAAVDAFAEVPVMTGARIMRNVDAQRLLGELYMDSGEFLKAEEAFSAGITLFDREKKNATVGTDVRAGHLFADMADLDYFISGDTEQALANYSRAVSELYDTPSVRYRIGAIQYNNKDYQNALGSFIKAAAGKPSDEHVLYSLGNVLFRRGDFYAAQGYYEKLLEILDAQRLRYGVMFPQVREDQGELVDLYMRGANNLGVTLDRLAQRTGDSKLNAQAFSSLSESVRAWDALTRNPETMVRVDGSNLAAQNITYMSRPVPEFEPEIYSEIPKTLKGEKIPGQNAAPQ